jgi:hypothetical protein
MADLYKVNCAYLAERHSHVTGLDVKKWTGSKFDDFEDISKAEAIQMIRNGDIFQAVSRDGSSTLVLVSEPCGMVDGQKRCTAIVLKTIADDSTTDNLDYMRCP